jgi:hypothetical protein
VLAYGSVARLILGILASSVLATIAYQAAPSDPPKLVGVVLATSLPPDFRAKRTFRRSSDL